MQVDGYVIQIESWPGYGREACIYIASEAHHKKYQSEPMLDRYDEDGNSANCDYRGKFNRDQIRVALSQYKVACMMRELGKGHLFKADHVHVAPSPAYEITVFNGIPEHVFMAALILFNDSVEPEKKVKLPTEPAPRRRGRKADDDGFEALMWGAFGFGLGTLID